MANTARTTAALLALFPDNVSEDISPQDARDLLVSKASYACLTAYDSTNVLAIANTDDTSPPVPNPWTVEGECSPDMTINPANGKISVTVPGVYLAVVSAQLGGEAETVGFRGSVDDFSTQTDVGGLDGLGFRWQTFVTLLNVTAAQDIWWFLGQGATSDTVYVRGGNFFLLRVA